MSTVESFEVPSRKDLDDFARFFGVSVRIAAETWDALIFQAEVDRSIGGRLRCLHRVRLPRELALRRRARTLVIGLVHKAGPAARCYHVREIVIGLSAQNQAEAERQAVMFAAAQVDLERRQVCGATAATLSAYVIEHAADRQL